MITKEECMAKYADKKILFVCDFLSGGFATVKDLRAFTESVFELFGYPVDGFSMRFEVNEKEHFKSYKYLNKRKEYFDDYNVDDLRSAYFDFLNIKGECTFCDRKGTVRIYPNYTKVYTVQGVFLPTKGEDASKDCADKVLHLLEEHFAVNYFCMDTMEGYKWPEMFVMGCSDELRNAFENEVAFLIQLSTIHHRLPFLFQYNYFYSKEKFDVLAPFRVKGKKNYFELAFPENTDKGLDEYCNNPRWKDMFAQLSELDIVRSEGYAPPSDWDEFLEYLQEFKGVKPDDARDRLESILVKSGRGDIERVKFNYSGDVIDRQTGVYLGSLKNE